MRAAWVRVLAVAAALLAAGQAAAEVVSGLDPEGDNFLSLRMGPGKNDAEIRRLGPGTRVTVIGAEGGRRRVRLEEATEGSAFGAYLAPYPAPAPPAAPQAAADRAVGSAAVVAGLSGPDVRLTLRAGPSRSAERLAALPPGTVLVVLGRQAEWFRVMTADGQIGWVHGDYLAPAGTAGSGAGDAGGLDWVRWENARFGMGIDYPAALFSPEPAPQNGDGQSFSTSDGRAGFFVFGQWNALGLSLEELRDMDLATGVFGRLTENRLGRSEFILAGVNAGRVTLRRALLPPPGDVLHVFEISYPEAESSLFAAVAARMAASFTVAGGAAVGAGAAGEGAAQPVGPAAADPLAELLGEELRALAERLP
jgi:uncharacterized protein YraI